MHRLSRPGFFLIFFAQNAFVCLFFLFFFFGSGIDFFMQDVKQNVWR
jgi:hypothetical protein